MTPHPLIAALAASARTATVVAAVVVGGALAAAPAARAESPCVSRTMGEGPVRAGFDEGDLGVVPAACPRTEVGVALNARAIVEEANFYGNLRGAGRIDVAYQVFPQLELFADVDAIAYQQVIQSFKADFLGLGDTSAGFKLLAFAHDSFALSVMTRADLPTSTGLYHNAFPVGLEAGILGVIEPVDDIRLHGGLLGGTKFALTKADSNARGIIAANAGIDLVIFDWLGLVGDIDAQALQRGGLDHLSLGFGARFVILDDVGAEVGAVVPVAGDERNLFTGVLRVSVPFD